MVRHVCALLYRTLWESLTEGDHLLGIKGRTEIEFIRDKAVFL